MENNFMVTTRSGDLVPGDIKKIQKKTDSATNGLKGVSAQDLEAKLHIQFYNGITTKDIQTSIIKTSVDMIDIDTPNYTYVAAKAFLDEQYHVVGNLLNGAKGVPYSHSLKDYLDYGVTEGRINNSFYRDFDLDELNRYIIPERDFLFNYLGIKASYDRYLLKNRKKELFELPQHMFMGIAMFLAQNEKNKMFWAKKFYDTISMFEIMLATPTLSNARTNRNQLSSCFRKGTPVKTIDGYTSIDELKEGDFVLTHKNRFMEVEELYEREFNGSLIKLKIAGQTRLLEATEEHPILSIKKDDINCIRHLSNCLLSNGKNKNCFKLPGKYKNDCEYLNKEFTGISKWSSIKDLDIGDFVNISFSKYEHNIDLINIIDYINLKGVIEDEDGFLKIKRTVDSLRHRRSFLNVQTKPIKNNIALDYNLMLFLGYFLAEGHISKDRTSLTFTFGSKEKFYIEEVLSITYMIFGYQGSLKENIDNSTSVIISNRLISEFIFELVGSGFNKKRLTNILKYANPEAQKGLLVGCFRGDSSAVEYGYILAMANGGLINDLFEIALRNGYSPLAYKHKNIPKLGNHIVYNLVIGSARDESFCLLVNKNISKINFNVKSITAKEYFWHEGEFYSQIRDKSEEQINETVYNIEVEEDHSYSVNNVSVHNCFQGCSDDNIESIFDTYKDMALLSKYGGGIGWDWANIRASNAPIDGHVGAGGGLIPWLKITNDIAIAVDQLGCVDRNSYVKVLDYVETDRYTHNFRKEYTLCDLNDQDIIEIVAGFASSFAFEYGKYSKNFISSLLYDYVINKNGYIFLENFYGINHDAYKKIIGKYKKINKGLPVGFEVIKTNSSYAISKEGVVIHIDSLRPISTIIDKKGYVRVTLGKESITLHKLLMQQYVGFSNEDTIDHIDTNKLNNNLDNLQIISNHDNISKSWDANSEKRTEQIRVKKFLSYGYNLDGKRSDYNINIVNIVEKIIPITKLRIGDLVLSYNTKTSKNEYKEILGIHEIEVKTKDQIKISFEDGNHITTSNWHPILKKRDNEFIFVRSDSLELGDICLTDNGDEVFVLSIDNNPCADENYMDLTVKGNNNYFCSTKNNEGSFYLIHNTRKGAIAVYIEPWHLDVKDFLDLKKNSGEERRRAHDLFPGLWINDLFMKRVEEDGIWTLFDPYDTSDLHELYGEDFEMRYCEYEFDYNIRKETVNAKDLWKKILLSYYETGSPFLGFKDEANRRNSNSHDGIIRCTNLCVTGDTRLATQFGQVKAKELFEMNKKILATYDYRVNGDSKNHGTGVAECIEMYKTKENAEIFELTTKDGYSIKSTEWHEYYILRNKSIIKIPLKDVIIGDKLMIQSDIGQFGKEGSYELGFISGLIAGDGTFSVKEKKGYSIAHIDLYNEDMNLGEKVFNCIETLIDKEYRLLQKAHKKDFKTIYPKVIQHTENSAKLRFSSGRLGRVLDEKFNFNRDTKQVVPEFIFKGKKEAVIGYLQGMFISDGTVNIIQNEGIPTFTIQLGSIHKNLLKDIQVLLSNFGIRSKIYDKGEKSAKDRFTYTTVNGEFREYHSKEMFVLQLNGNNAIKFISEIGFIGPKQEKALSVLQKRESMGYTRHSNKSEKFEVEITSIKKVGVEDVYDTTQLLNHSLIFNGLVTGNCTEIFQNTTPNKYAILLELAGEKEFLVDENVMIDIVLIDGTIESKIAKKLSNVDRILIDGNIEKIEFISHVITEKGETLVCNLGSVNLSKVNSKEDMARVVPIGIRMLDNVIDLNMYPIKQAYNANKKSRAIGLGVMGEAQMLAEKGIYFGSDIHLNEIDKVMEWFSYYSISTSADLAAEKGIYPLFEGSKWSKGILPIDTANKNALLLVDRELDCDWDELREKVISGGMRNGYLMAIAPTSTISIVTGTTQAIEPIYRVKYYEENLSGLIPVVAPNISPDTISFYQNATAYNVDQLDIVRAGGIRQKWIDQGQSLNIFMRKDKASGQYLNNIYMLGWKLGLKATYYLRSESPEEIKTEVIDRGMECSGCQ